MVCFFEVVVTMDPFIMVILNGSCRNGGENVFFFSCLGRTGSSTENLCVFGIILFVCMTYHFVF